MRSFTTRQRLTLLLTCSIRSRRWCRVWLASCSSNGSSWPRGFLVGMRIVTWGNVNARKPRSCNNRLPAGKGYGVASAMRLSWRRPPQVSLRKRDDHGGGVGFRDAEPLGEGGQRAGRGVAEGTECRQQRRQENMNPLIRFPLHHPEQAPLHHLEGIGFQVDQNKQ